MLDFKKVQKQIWSNKLEKKFNTTDVGLEFSLTHGELSEAFNAYVKKLPDVGEELADVFIYLVSLAQMLGVDLEKEIVQKIAKNKKRKFKIENGVHVRIEG
ncbi:MAG: MazG-like family protein [Patescibacteria group bacterium]